MERDRTRLLQGKGLSVAEGDFTIATGGSSFCSCSPSLAHDVDEEVSTLLPWERKVIGATLT